MNKIKVVFTIVFMFVFSTNIFALCNDQELVDSAEKIKVEFIEDSDFEIISKDANGNEVKTNIDRQFAYVLSFTPYNEDLLIGAVDSIDNELVPAVYHALYKSPVIGSGVHYEPKKYEIYIYSQKKDSCYGELLRTMEYTVPEYNTFSSSDFCKDNPNISECAIQYDTSKLTEERINELKRTTEISNMTFIEKALYNVKRYWYFILIPILLISIYYVVKIVSYRKKASRI